MNYFYSLGKSQNNLILKAIELLNQKIHTYETELMEMVESLLSLISLATLTQTNFQLVDKEFQSFGKEYLKELKNYSKLTKIENDLMFDSFAKLVLSNIAFANSDLFPQVDILLIENKLQVQLLMNGMYFRLLPNVLYKCSDIHFQFE
jgi:hypothetical protein